MTRSLGAMLAVPLVLAAVGRAGADEAEGKATLDKAIAAVGGEEALAKAKVISWEAKGTLTFGENETEFTSKATLAPPDRYRSQFESEFNGNPFKAVTVVDGDKGWRKFGDNVMEMDDQALADDKRRLYLLSAPILLVPLRGKGFKVESAGEENVGDKPADVLKVTGPDGKPFRLSLDRESHLPVKLVATVPGFQGDEFEQTTTYADYKEFGGIKKATRIQSQRDGNPFLKEEITSFKVMEKADDGTFTAPE